MKITLNMPMKMKAMIPVRTAVVNTAVVEEAAPKKAPRTTKADTSLDMAMKMLAALRQQVCRRT